MLKVQLRVNPFAAYCVSINKTALLVKMKSVSNASTLVRDTLAFVWVVALSNYATTTMWVTICFGYICGIVVVISIGCFLKREAATQGVGCYV